MTPTHSKIVKNINENAMSNNECYISYSVKESSGGIACKGCARRFVPTGPQVYCSHACYSESLRQPIEPRFWAKVNKNGPVPAHVPELGACWVWTASKFHCGYGQFVLPRTATVKQPHVYAHRYSFVLSTGREPVDQVLHKCDNRACVRPDHLFEGTQQDNVWDAMRKGRLVPGRHAIKLSEADLRTIRDTYRPRINGKQLAARYGVSLMTIMRVVAGTARSVHELHGSKQLSSTDNPMRG